jgi:PPE family protein
VGLDFGLGDNRWQGYSHEELYAMLHAGPGPSAAGVTADRWSAMAGALSDIQQDISSGVASSGASWVGDAGDVARAALNPLGDWAQQASAAADVMRASTELQGDLLSKARAEMPAPVPIPQQTSQISQLVTAQVDYEVAEAASQVAAQQAFQVMAQYEAGTTDNTSTLGEFDQPPALRVDTTPITGVAVRGRVGRTASPRRVPRTTSTRSGAPVEESVGRSPNTTATTAPTEEPTPPPAVEEPISGVSSAEPTPTPEPVAATPPADSATNPPPTTSSAPDPAPAPSTAPSSAGSPGSTTPSSAVPVTESPTGAGQLITPTTSSRNRDDNGTTSTPTPRPATGTFVPAARRANRDDEPDEEHESKYLILADDIYGDQAYSPPVIGEHRPHR